MPATQRRDDKSIIRRLLDEPYRFQFFQAVRLVVQWLGEHGVAPDKALVDYLRFDNSLSFTFPAGEIEAMRVAGDADLALVTDAAMAQALLDEQLLQVRITPSFMGFLGETGALPQHYTERIAAYQSLEKDEAPRAFFDMFSSRVLALFYEAWRKYRMEYALADGKDAFLPLLLAVAGFKPGAEVNNTDGVCDETIALYAGVLQQRPVSAVILTRVLANYFEVPVRLEESNGFWSPLEPREQCSLGGMNATLGDNTLLGQRSWRPDLGARLSIGPLSRAGFERFLPGAAASLALRKMLSLFGDQTVTYEVKLILKAQEIGQLCLAGAAGPGSHLGQDSFMVTVASALDRGDVSYTITPLAPLAPLAPPHQLDGARP